MREWDSATEDKKKPSLIKKLRKPEAFQRPCLKLGDSRLVERYLLYQGVVKRVGHSFVGKMVRIKGTGE